ncbi:MAG: hypothetical protein FWH17_00675 [Oscillospiraceae bacterium]|nr:hypothetical protein [Oscillospiraceae bacterium]
MKGKKGYLKRKVWVIFGALSVFVFVFMVKYVVFSLGVSDSHLIRFMSAEFLVCLVIAVSLFVVVVVRKLKEIKAEEQYEHIKRTKSVSENGTNECQSCGNRQVAEADKSCKICGIKFLGRLN